MYPSVDVTPQKPYHNRPIDKTEAMAMSTWPDISNLSILKPELVNVLRQMGPWVKWPQNMKAIEAFKNKN